MRKIIRFAEEIGIGIGYSGTRYQVSGSGAACGGREYGRRDLATNIHK
jgi:hypothetical protein